MDHPPSPNPPAPDFNWDSLVVYFSEIALKRGNRRHFTRKLRDNLKRALSGMPTVVQFVHDRLYITPPADRLDEALERASRVFGVENLAPVKMLPRDVDVLCRAGVDAYRAQGKDGASFGVQVKRADKRFPLNSQQLQVRIGTAVGEATGAPVNLSNPDVPLRFRISEEEAYLEGPKIRGPGGANASKTRNCSAR